MRRAIVGLAAAVSLIAPTGADAAAVITQLQPALTWRVDYSTERCSLSQQYGTGEQAILLQIDSYGGWANFTATLVGKGVPKTAGPQSLGSLRFPGDPAGREVSFLAGKTNDGDQAVSFDINFVPYEEYERLHELEKANLQDSRPDRPYPGFDRTVSAFVVAFPSGQVVQLNVHALAAPLAALRTCVDSLLKSWGLDPAVERNLSRAAVPRQSDVVLLQHSYPMGMLRNGVSALVQMRVMIDAEGRPSGCTIQLPKTDPEFKTAVCGSLRHFEPALDANGKPVASIYSSAITFLTSK